MRSYIKTDNLLKKISGKNYNIIFCFGEIDCRVQIKKSFLKSNNYFDYDDKLLHSIDNCIDRYFKLIRYYKDRFNCFILNVVPPQIDQVTNFETSTSPEERLYIVGKFNERLKNKSEEFGVNFIDVYSELSNENGYAILDYLIDDIHFGDFYVKVVKNFLEINS